MGLEEVLIIGMTYSEQVKLGKNITRELIDLGWGLNFQITTLSEAKYFLKPTQCNLVLIY